MLANPLRPDNLFDTTPPNMAILITGVAGFIGSHLAEALLAKGESVIGIDNFNDFYSPDLKRKNLEDIKKTAKKEKTFFQCYAGDICDADLVESALANHKVDCIIHLAAMAGVGPSIQKPLVYEKVNGLGTLTILEAAKKENITKIIFGSSSSVYGLNQKVPFAEDDPVNLPFSPYAQTKRAGELQCHVYHKLYNMSFAVLRFFTVYGPRQRPDLAILKFTELAYAREPIPVFGDGSNSRDFTYIDDIVAGIIKSLAWLGKNGQPKFEIFNLGKSATTSVIELIRLLEKATTIPFKKEFRPALPGDVPITYADITKSRMVLGYEPTTPLQDGIEIFVKWYLDTHR